MGKRRIFTDFNTSSRAPWSSVGGHRALAKPPKAIRPIRSSVRRAAKRAEAGPCVGQAADRLNVDVGDEEAFHGSGEEGGCAAAPGTSFG